MPRRYNRALTVYKYPLEHDQRPHLFRGMIYRASHEDEGHDDSSSHARRREDQCTEALAWLLDRDSDFALRFARDYVDHNEEATGRLEGVKRLGVETQIRRLPALGSPGTLRPDLSLTTPTPDPLQLLIEVKVGPANPNEVATQVGGYVHAWKHCVEQSAEQEAKVHLVGTLTVGGNVPPHEDPQWRAADLEWKDIAGLLKHVQAPEVAAVADDFRTFIEDELYGVVPASRKFLKAGRELVDEVVGHLRDHVEDGCTKHARDNPSHTGTYLHFTTRSGDCERLLILVTAQAAFWARQGSPTPALWLHFPRSKPPKPRTEEALRKLDPARFGVDDAGFSDRIVRQPGFKPFFGIRLMELDAESLPEDLPKVSAKACTLALGLLSEAGLLKPM